MLEWIRGNETLVLWMAIGSIVVFVGTLVALPLLLIRIPADYFLPGRRQSTRQSGRSAPMRWAVLLVRNLVGIFLVLAGIVMLVLPGQGLLTILAGFMLTSFPGRNRLERWIVGKPAVLGTIDWLRRRAGKSPLILDETIAPAGQEPATGTDIGKRP